MKFSEVAGKCYLAYSENLDQHVEEWTAGGPNRFHFSQSYNASEKTFVDPPNRAMNIGKCGKGKGKAKCKSKKSETNNSKKAIEKPAEYCAVPRKLKTLDVFAGCGGEHKYPNLTMKCSDSRPFFLMWNIWYRII